MSERAKVRELFVALCGAVALAAVNAGVGRNGSSDLGGGSAKRAADSDELRSS